MQCSSGTYIRTLTTDLGHLLGSGTLRDLRRTAIGSFTEDEAAPPNRPSSCPRGRQALRDYERVVVDAAVIRHGQRLPAFAGPPPWALLSADGTLLAVYDAHPDGATPVVVLAGA